MQLILRKNVWFQRRETFFEPNIFPRTMTRTCCILLIFSNISCSPSKSSQVSSTNPPRSSPAPRQQPAPTSFQNFTFYKFQCQPALMFSKLCIGYTNQCLKTPFDIVFRHSAGRKRVNKPAFEQCQLLAHPGSVTAIFGPKMPIDPSETVIQ